MEGLKRVVSVIAIIFLGVAPMAIYLDIVMDVELRDFGFWKALGFAACMIFYSEATKTLRK